MPSGLGEPKHIFGMNVRLWTTGAAVEGQFVSRKKRAVPRLVSVTETFVPLRTFKAESPVQGGLLVEIFVVNWRVKPLNGAGQEIFIRPLVVRFVIERNGKGQTVVMVVARLLALLGSERSLPTDTVFVMGPIALGVTTMVSEADPLLLMVPRSPVTGLALVDNTP